VRLFLADCVGGTGCAHRKGRDGHGQEHSIQHSSIHRLSSRFSKTFGNQRDAPRCTAVFLKRESCDFAPSEQPGDAIKAGAIDQVLALTRLRETDATWGAQRRARLSELHRPDIVNYS
jgi:hypothetical protein